MTSFRRCARAVFIAGWFGAGALATVQAAPERGPQPRPVPAPSAETEARVIVRYRAESALMRSLSAKAAVPTARHARELSARVGLTLRDGRSIGARSQVVKAQGVSSAQLAARLSAEPDVEFAEVDRRVHGYAVPSDPLYPPQTATTPAVGQWYLRAPTGAGIVDATTVVSAINAEAAWAITHANAKVVVADLDTGVRGDHPDLAPKLLPGYDFISDVPTAADGDARDPDASDPGDYGCATGAATSSWHGTQTAGLIGAATDNGMGMAGAGYNVRLLPVRVLGQCGGFDSDIQAAMLWAAGVGADPTVNPNPARVINLSLGSAGACGQNYAAVVQQVVAAGVVVVAAAGNDGLAVGSPANCPGVIAVAGLRHAGTKVGYSDLGPEIAVGAPAGNCVNATGTCLFPLLTTSNKGTTTPVLDKDGGSIYTDGGANASLGTSFAAPLVSGTVGLMFASNPALTPAQVLDALKSTARAYPTANAGPAVAACVPPSAASAAQNTECYCTAATCGAGMLDAGLAVAKVATVVADIAATSTATVVGTPVTLDASASTNNKAGPPLTFQWALVSGPATLTVDSGTDPSGARVIVQPTAPGDVVVDLVVTNQDGLQAHAGVKLSVAAVATPPAATPPPVATSSGGGGALGPAWLLAWLAAVGATWAVRPRAGRR